MAIEKNQLIAIIAAVVVVVALAVSAVFVLKADKDEPVESLIIAEGETITQSQLDSLKERAADGDNVELVYKAEKYTVVFDSKAVSSIGSVADLELTNVDAATLPAETKNLVGEDAKVININYGSNTNFGEGTVKVTVPFTVPAGQNADDAVCAYLADDGTMEIVPVDISKSGATLTLKHFSSYSIFFVSEDRTLDGADLMVLGNANGDRTIDAADLAIIEKLAAKKIPAEVYPLADADKSGTIDSADVDLITKVINKETATIWHVNFHDADGNGTMDRELVSSKIPVTSAITTGSTNTFILLYSLGIVDEIKGASYGSTNDKFLFEDNYLNTKKVVKLGTSSSAITLEDGKAGSSNVIADQNVTCLLSDWNRTYIENEADFEKVNVDVVRVAAASVDPEVYTHSLMLLGLMFNKVDNATSLVDLYDKTFDDISKALTEAKAKKAVASSMAGYMSSADSDYTAFCLAAGAKFGLEGFNFNGAASINTANNLSVFDNRQYSYDNIVHIRTSLAYGATSDAIAKDWSTYANAMKMWEHAYDGQIMVSGVVPIPVRVAYIAYGMYGADVPAVSKTWADGLHSEFTKLYAKDVGDITTKTFVLTSYNFAVNIEDGVTVKTVDGKAVSNGDKFPYGTKLVASPTVVKEKYVLNLLGGELADDNSFVILNDVTIRYVDPAVLKTLKDAAENFANYNGFYGSVAANKTTEGSIAITGTSYKKETTVKELGFNYYLDTKDAKAAYDAMAEYVVSKKSSTNYYVDAEAYGDLFDGLTFIYSSSKVSDKSLPTYGAYTGSTLYFAAYKGNMVIGLDNTYMSQYCWNDSYNMTDADRLAYFKAHAEQFVKALAYALNGLVEIPGEADDAQAAAEDIVKEVTTDNVTYSIVEGATENSVLVKQSYMSTKTQKETINYPFKVLKSSNPSVDYKRISDILDAKVGVESAYMTGNFFEAYSGKTIDGVIYKAIAKQSTSALYIKFVMACGDIVIDGQAFDATGAAIEKGSAYVPLTDFETVEEYLTAIATGLIPTEFTPAQAAANAVVKIVDEKTIAFAVDAENSTEDAVIIKETYTGRSGETVITPITVKKVADGAAAYAAAVTDLDARVGSDKAYMEVPYDAYELKSEIAGVSCHAIAKITSSTIYIKFVIVAGDIVVDGFSLEKGCYVPLTDFETPEEYLGAVAAAVVPVATA